MYLTKNMKNLLFLVVYFFFYSYLTLGQQRIFINEFLASNVSVNADIVDFDDYSDWIELYNNEDFDIELAGYFITDDPDNPTKWEIPQETVIKAKDFLLFWADGFDEKPGEYIVHSGDDICVQFPTINTSYYHLNFKLSRAGEYIGLYAPDGAVVDSVSFGLQYPDVSMGRKPDGSPDMYYFGEPTPEESNTTEEVIVPEFSGKPGIAEESGFYSGSTNVTINPTTPGARLSYTLDGSKPADSSATNNNPFIITETTVLRTRQFEEGKLPGNIPNRTYFIDENISLPVISIITPPNMLWDSIFGIYTYKLKRREIPISFEFFPTNNSPGLRLNAGLRLTGESSLCFQQMSFTITARDRYGTDDFNYQFFPERAMNSFKSVYIRNAGYPDKWSTLMRDGLMQSLVINKMDIDCQAYRPSVVFINGKYWGIYNIRDKISTEYLGILHNINPNEIDLLEYVLYATPRVKEGNRDNYTAFYDFIDSTDLSIEENYRFIENWMDIDEFINYNICEIYYDNMFWPNRNIRMWRERKEDAKWRWILFDLDFAFGMSENWRSTGYTNNTLLWATSQDTVFPVAPKWSTRILVQLLKNEEFKTKFIQRFAGYMNTVFHPDTVVDMIHQFRNTLSPEMPRHIERWADEDSMDFRGPIPNHDTWMLYVDTMIYFAQNRPYWMRKHIVDFFALSGTSVLNLDIDSLGMGIIAINDVVVSDKNSSGIYFRNVLLNLEAMPKVGYRFTGWTGAVQDTLNQISLMLTSDTVNLVAVFDTNIVNTVPTLISSDTILSKADSPWYATGDIIVDSSTTLTIESGVELLMPEEACIIVYGRLLVEGTELEPVTIAPNEYADSWGALCFINATDSSSITNLKIKGATQGHDFARDKAAISGYNTDFSLDRVTITKAEAPIYIQFGNVAIRACTLYANVAGDLINVKYAESVLVEDCDLLGSDNFDSDAIDYDQLSNGIIRGNRIRNFYGSNSDAIDLGENSQNILIENNIIYNIDDKGISIGNGSSGIIKRNIIANCGQGIGVKDYYSYGYAEHNTFYGNGFGIASFVKNTGKGGGNADVVNCIIANSKSGSIFKDKLSTANISYSISNTDLPEGMHNRQDDPHFLNNLRLANNSPAIDFGNPTLPNDPDGSIADIGAFAFDPDKQDNLIINEIHYNPAEGDQNQFIEILNAGSAPVNLANFKLSGNISYTFPNVDIAAGEYLLVARNQSIYQGQGYAVHQWERGDLNDMPGRLDFWNDQGEIIDFVDYHSRYQWPAAPDGNGPSLELQRITYENMVSTSWRSSYSNAGTPGRSNNSVEIEGIYINEFMASNTSSISDEFGDFVDWIEFYNSTSEPVNLGGLYITDDLDNPLKFQIPDIYSESTTIPGKGFKLFWADGQPERGALHLSFKLERDGEQIGLVQLMDDTTSFIDSLSYSIQKTDTSMGRYSDGANGWYSLIPTPLQPNKLLPIQLDIVPTVIGITSLMNYPNPFRDKTLISYMVQESSNIILSIYDISGRKINTLVEENQPAGSYEIEWNAENIKPGIYFCRLQTGNYEKTIKLMVSP